MSPGAAGDPFHNPYHFVPANGQAADAVPVRDVLDTQERRPNDRTQHLTHARYLAGPPGESAFFSGRIVCTLETVQPVVVGGVQAPDPKGKDYATVAPFELPKGTPALPASSLRGLIGSIVEAATDSAMRVLTDEPYSYRSDVKVRHHRQGAIGMIVEKEEGGRVVRKLRPLTFPPLEVENARASEGFPVPPEYSRFADKLVLPVYLDRPFLATNRPNSFRAAGPGTRGLREGEKFWRLVCRPFRRARDGERWSLDGDRRDLKIKPTAQRQFLLGVWGEGSPTGLEAHEVERCAVRGILRVLGVGTEREKDLPHLKRHELFIPVPDLDYFANGHRDADGSDCDLDAEEAIAAFEALARSRTESEGTLPFELVGQDRRGKQLENGSHAIRLAHGDLVHFRPGERDGRPVVASLAISSVWRRGAGTALTTSRRRPSCCRSDPAGGGRFPPRR